MLIVKHALQCVDGCFFFILPHLTLCFWHTEFRFKFFVKIDLLEKLNIEVVWFVFKKLLMYLEKLIVPHALHCVDSCIFVFTSFDSLAYCFGSVPAPQPLPQFFYQIHRLSFFVKIHLLESSQLEM